MGDISLSLIGSFLLLTQQSSRRRLRERFCIRGVRLKLCRMLLVPGGLSRPTEIVGGMGETQSVGVGKWVIVLGKISWQQLQWNYARLGM